MSLFIQWLVSALAICVTALLLPGVSVGFGSALIAAIVLGLVNIFIKPLILLFTLPINFLTFGLFSLVINDIVIMIVAAIVPGFKVSGLGMGILFALLLSIINVIFFAIV